jgi:iron complex outermembrane receptor protein
MRRSLPSTRAIGPTYQQTRVDLPAADRAGPAAGRRYLGSAIALVTLTLAMETAAQQLEEVVVTATRRDASVLDIPYNISAIGANELRANRIGEINDITQHLAGVSFVNTGPSNKGRNNNLTLRGLTGDDATNNGGFPAATVAPVSMYIGETPLFLPLQLNDVARVEVLRGPQGTLYGSGSLAGTIRVIPNNPDPEAFYAEMNADLGAMNASSEWNRSLSGIFNIPLSDSVALRFSGGYKHWGGFIDMNNLVAFDAPDTAVNSPLGIPTAADPDNINSGFVLRPVKKNANDADIWNLRASLLWQITDRVQATFSAFHQRDEVDNLQADYRSFAGGNIDFLPAAANPFSPNTAGPVDYPTGGTLFRPSSEYGLPRLLEEPSERTTDLFNLELSADLGFASLTSTTSYYEDDQKAIIDVSAGISVAFGAFYGFLPRLVDIDYTRNRLKGVAQEIRLVSSGDGPLDYAVGLFYQNVKTDDDTIQYIPGQTLYDSISVGFHANPQLGDINYITRNATDFEDFAVFAELTWNFSERWQVTGGVRYFDQEFAVDTFSQLPYCGIFCGDNELGDTVVTADSRVSDSIFKLNTSYNLSSDTMVYATYAEGFRRGGANGIPLSGPFAANPELLLYAPDRTRNYEVGIKGRLLDQTASLTAYHIDWENLQINDSAAAGGYDLVANGDSARSRGIELELSGAPFEGFSYRLSYAYIDAEIDSEFEILDNFFGEVAPIISTRKGDPLPNTSENSVSLNLTYQHSVANYWQLTWQASGFYRSEVNSGLVSLIPGDPQPFVIDGFSVWDFSATLDKGPITAVLYLENAFDSRAVTGGVDDRRVGERGKLFYVGRPQTVGLGLTYRFGG